MFALPVLVYGTDAAGMARAFGRAMARGLDVAVYTDDLFGTGNDADNRAMVAPVATDDLKPAGFAVTGPRRDVDKALDKVRLHPWPRPPGGSDRPARKAFRRCHRAPVASVG
jgi:hypothetical protein